MFIQVISGTTNDPEGLHRQADRWEQEVRAGAQAMFEDLMAAITIDEYLDLQDPWLR